MLGGILKLLLLVAVLSSDVGLCKKKSKMNDMLKSSVEKEKALEEEKQEELKRQHQLDTAMPEGGFYPGKVHFGQFEYAKLNGWMTPMKAIDICEANLACGGFTFRGPNISNLLVYVHFVHFIYPDGIDIVNSEGLKWSTYRATKKYIVLPGKPLLKRDVVPVHDDGALLRFKEDVREAISDKVQTTKWPPSPEVVSLSFWKKNDEIMVASRMFILSEHDFSQTDWLTVINVNAAVLTNGIYDGTHLTKENCCPDVTQPLDFERRYDHDIDDNIQTIACDSITKEQFEETYVRKRTPVKLTGCLENGGLLKKWDIEGVLAKKEDELKWHASVDDTKHKDLAKTGDMFSGRNVNEVIQKQGWIKAASLLNNDDVDYKRPDCIPVINQMPSVQAVTVATKGTGLPLKTFHDPMCVLATQITGSKWWTIVPSAALYTTDTTYNCRAHCSGTSAFGDESITAAAAWFNHMQPQLSRVSFYGQPVVQTVQKPGDMLYIPGDSLFATYSVEDSLFITDRFVTVADVDNLSRFMSTDDQTYKEVYNAVNKMDKQRMDVMSQQLKDWKASTPRGLSQESMNILLS